MSKRFFIFALSLVLTAALPGAAQERKTASGEEFFIIASIDQSKSQVLLKRASEVTTLAQVTPKTQYFDEKGKAIRLSDLRAGDTVWAVTTGSEDKMTVTRLRKGPMTVSELHQYYLDYPEIK